MGNSVAAQQRKMDKTVFDLKFAAKGLERDYAKAEKKRKKNEKKVVDLIRAGDMERARIYAETAVRQKKEGLNALKLASRLDGVVSRIQAAQAMQKITPQLEKASDSIGVVMGSMNTEKMASVMDKFETVCDDLDVRASYMEGAMDSATASTTPADDVHNLMEQIAAEAGLELAGELEAGGAVPTGVAAPGRAVAAGAAAAPRHAVAHAT